MPDPLRSRLPGVLVLVAAAAVYANTLTFGAAWDDTRFVFQSGATEGIGAAASLILSPYLRDVPPARSPYRPVTAVSYALDWSVGGGRAAFFHWTNVALHVGVTGLLLGLLLALGIPQYGAMAGTLWFAVHPVHVEAVANLAGRAELLAALFALGSLWLYLAGAANPVRRRWLLAGSVIAFGMALGAKENAVVVLPLLGLLALFRPGSAGLRERARPWGYWAGLVMVAAAYMLLRRYVLGTFTTVDVAPFIGSLPVVTRLSTAVANWWEYARLMAVPVDLVVDYGPAVILPSEPLSLGVARGLLVVGAVAGALALFWRTSKLPTLGVLWFFVAVLPVSNLLVPIAQWLAERFLYLPSAGIALVVAAVGPHVMGRREARRVLGASFGLWIVLMAARTWTRNESWRDTETVAATLVEEHPEAFRSQWLLGAALLRAGQPEDGLAALDRALALNPGAMELHLERASWLVPLGRAEEAEEALRALPAGMHPDREAHLARALLAQDRLDEAMEILRAGVEAFPANGSLQSLRDSVAGLGVSGSR